MSISDYHTSIYMSRYVTDAPNAQAKQQHCPGRPGLLVGYPLLACAVLRQSAVVARLQAQKQVGEDVQRDEHEVERQDGQHQGVVPPPLADQLDGVLDTHLGPSAHTTADASAAAIEARTEGKAVHIRFKIKSG